jgi:hypothetical protein
MDALADAVAKINASLPKSYTGPKPVTSNLLTISSQADQLTADPVGTYRAI